MLTLKELCNESGASRRAVQGFEKAGLLAATAKDKYGRLLYDDGALDAVKRILMYQGFGFKMKELAEFDGCDEAEKIRTLAGKEEELIREAERIKKAIGMIRAEKEKILGKRL